MTVQRYFGACRWVIGVVVALLVAASTARAQSVAGYSEYYVPGNEDEMSLALRSFFTDYTVNMHALISITSWSDNVTIYYDHWENGLTFDPANPGATADEVITLATQGTLRAFDDTPSGGIPVPRNSSQFFYDGGDHIYVAGGAVTVTRVSYLESRGRPVQAVAWEIYPVTPQLTTYVLPFGENLYPTFTDFERTFVLIQATENNTTFTVDLDGNGTADALDTNFNGVVEAGEPSVHTLQAGQTFLLGNVAVYPSPMPRGARATVNSGAVVQGSATLQVKFVIGDPNANYETRGLSAFPRGYWTKDYYVPVPEPVSTDKITDIFLYNPHGYSITIGWQSRTGTGSFTIAAGVTTSFRTAAGSLPTDGGVYLNGSDIFWGVSTVDSTGQVNEWAYSLLPSTLLYREHFLGWAPCGAVSDGGDDSGVFLTVVQDNTRVFVDTDNDGIENQTYTLNRLQTQYITDPTDYDLSGSHFWATGDFTMSYGQNPDTAPPQAQSGDLGYVAIPGTDFISLVLGVSKSVNPVVVSPTSGSTSVFTLTVDSRKYSVEDVHVMDKLALNWEYYGPTQITLPDMSTITTAPIVTSPGSPLPSPPFTGNCPVGGGACLTWDDSVLGDMAENQQIVISFTARTSTGIGAGTLSLNRVKAIGTRTFGDPAVTQTFTATDFAYNVTGALSITKSSNAPDPVFPGDTYTYTVTVSNPAASPAQTNATLYDPIPAGVTYVPGSGSSTCQRTPIIRDEFATVAYNNNGPGHTENWAGDWTETDAARGSAASGEVLVTAGGALQLGPVVPAQNVQDQFGVQAYNNNNGTAKWAGDWAETDGGGGGATGGRVLVTAGGVLQLGPYLNEIVRDEFATQAYNNNGPGNTVTWAGNWIETDGGGGGAKGGRVYVTTGATNELRLGPYLDESVRDEFGTVAYDNNNGSASWAGSWVETDAAFGGATSGRVLVTAGGVLQLGPVVNANVRDDFGTVAYNNNNGSAPWYGNWVETDQLVGGAVTGLVLITGSQLQLRYAAPAARDEFSTNGSYAGTNGTAGWSANWTETNDDNDPANGYILVLNNRVQFYGQGTADRSISRTVNVSGSTSATISFVPTDAGIDLNETIVAEYSLDGGTYTTLQTYNGNNTPAGWSGSTQSFAVALSSNTTLTLRFRAPQAWSSYADDLAYIDTVNIAFNAPTNATGSSILRTADLRDATSATLTFGYTGANLDANDDRVVVEASSDGIAFTTLETFNGANGSGTRTYDLASYASARTTIRFRVTTGFNATNETFSIDDVNILYVDPSLPAIQRTVDLTGATTPSLDFSTTASGTLAAGDTMVVEASTSPAGPFTVLGTATGTGAFASAAKPYILTPYISATTTIRFRITGGYDTAGKYRTFDWVQIAYGFSSPPAIQRTVNLTGATNPSLDFDTAPSGTLAAGDTMVVEASSSPAGPFTVLGTATGGAAFATGAKPYSLTPYISATTTIRFRISGGYNNASKYRTLDNLQISYQYSSMPAIQRTVDLTGATNPLLSFTTATSGMLDNPGDTMVVEASNSPTGTFTVLATATGGGAWAPVGSYSLTPYISATTTIRFRIIGGYAEAGEWRSLDTVRIDYQYATLPYIQRTVDLTGATNPSLSFATVTPNNLENADIMVVEASSSPTGTFTELDRAINDNAFAPPASYDLTPYISSATTIRFRILGGYAEAGEYRTFDNVNITYTTYRTGRPPEFLRSSDGCGIAAGGALTLTFNVIADNPFPSGQTSITNTASTTTAAFPIPLYASVTDDVQNPSVQSASVGDRVWLDADREGDQDIGEPGIANVEMTLKDQFGTPVAVTVTDSLGYYLFTGVEAGTGYYVEATDGVPIGLSQTFPSGYTNNQTTTFNLVDGQVLLTADLGYGAATGTVAFGDLTWVDSDADGLHDLGEVALGGVTIRLYQDSNGNGAMEPLTDTFVAVPTMGPGTIALTQGSAAVVGTNTKFTSLGATDTITIAGVTYTISSVTDDTHLTLGAAYSGTTTSGRTYDVLSTPGSGTVLATLNSAAVVGTGTTFTSLLPGDPIEIKGVKYKVSTVTDNTHLTLTTNYTGATTSGLTYGIATPTISQPDGSYLFTGVTPTGPGNTYFVSATTPAGYTNTGSASYRFTDVVAGTAYLTADFGFNSTSTTYTLTDRVWRDTSFSTGPGTVTATFESPLVVGGTTPTTTTFKNLNAGDTIEIAGVSYTIASVTDDTHLTLTTNYTGTTGSGKAYTSWGTYDSTREAGIASVTVELLDMSRNIIGTTITDANGLFTFSGLAGSGADYTTRITDDYGVLTNYFGTSSYALAGERSEPNLEHDNIDRSTAPSYGFNTSRTIGDTVFNDENGNGFKDASESGIAGVVVRLHKDANANGLIDLAATGTVTATNDSATVTGSGTTFFNYHAGEPITLAGVGYTIQSIASNTSLTLTTNYSGTDGSKAFSGNPAGTGTVGTTINSNAVTGAATTFLTDFKAGDPITINGADYTIASVTSNTALTLTTNASTTASGLAYRAPVFTGSVTTDGNGKYLFAGLANGSYIVSVQNPSLYNYIGVDIGTVTTQNGNPNVVGAGTLFTKLVSGETITITRGGVPTTYTIASITDDTNLTLTTNYPATASGLTYGRPDSDTTNFGTQLGATISGTGNVLDRDFGFQAVTPCSVSGTVWNDINANGVINSPPETGIGTVTIDLISGTTVVATTQTSSIQDSTLGTYSFNGLAPGTYTVRVTDTLGQLTGYNPTYEVTEVLTGSFNYKEDVTLTSGNVPNINFGYKKPVPTYASVESFGAFVSSRTVFVEWRTSFEVGILGFDLERYNPDTASYERLNESLLPVMFGHPEGGIYRFRDDRAPLSGVLTYKLIEMDFRGDRREFGPYTAPLSDEVSGESQARHIDTESWSMTDVFERHPKEVSELEMERVAILNSERGISEAAVAAGRGGTLKITTNAGGLHYLSANRIAIPLGIKNGVAAAKIAKGDFALTNLGTTIPYLSAVDGSGLYFYAEELDSIYTSENAYWLSDKRGKTMRRVPEGFAGSSVSSFEKTIHREINVLELPAYSQNPESDYWAWDEFWAGYPGLDRKSFSVQVPAVVPTAEANLKVLLKGGSDLPNIVDHHAFVYWNSAQVGEAQWDGIAAYEFDIALSAGSVREGNNTLEVAIVKNQGVTDSHVYLDFFDLTYQRLYMSENDELDFTAPSQSTITIGGFSSPGILIFDITTPEQPGMVAATIIPVGGRYQAQLTTPSGTATRHYLAVLAERAKTPVRVVANQSAGLSRGSNGADYVIIAPTSLMTAAGSLAQYRNNLGIETRVVDLEGVYNEFNYGIASPHAIKSFLFYAVNNWRIPPKYATLIGRGTYDYKNYKGRGDNLVPPLMAAGPFGLFVSDNRMADLTGDDGVPEIALGRLPVLTSQELLDYLAKIQVHEPASHPSRFLMTADNNDTAGSFNDDSDAVAAVVPPEQVVKVYLPAYSGASGKAEILKQINTTGVLLFNYIGHGGPTSLTGENLFASTDVGSLTNTSTLPIFLGMTCAVGNFSIPGYQSLSESMLLKQTGGIYAAWSSTGLAENDASVVLDKAFFQTTFVQGEKVLGNIIVTSLHSPNVIALPVYMRNIYSLLGEPVSRLP